MTTAHSKVAPPASSAPPHNGFSLISNEKLLAIYSTMLKCRTLEARIRTLSKENGAAAFRAAVRQEAAIAGAAIDLLPGDTLAPAPHGFVAAFVKGLPLSSIFSMVAPNGVKPRASYARLNLIPPSLSLAAQLDRVIDVATANKKAKNKQIVVAFCGHASAAPEALHDAMCQAGKRDLPILLVCHSDSESDEICLKAKECDFPGVVVDGDDAVAVYRVATEAMAHARRGSGPTLIDCKPWVLPGLKSAERRTTHDPILRMEAYLKRKDLFDAKIRSKVAANFRRELAAASNANGPKQF